LGEQGMAIDFWKIAMRPGKPLIFGHIGATKFLGLPGNPVSSLVCAAVFLRPALKLMLGEQSEAGVDEVAIAGRDLAENDSRQDYLRARLSRDNDGRLVATPFDKQDSSMQFLLQQADCLVIRPPRAAALPAGTPVPILRLEDAGGL
jgi:molybdopterin molybdotransferase